MYELHHPTLLHRPIPHEISFLTLFITLQGLFFYAMKHCISIAQFSRQDIETLLQKAKDIKLSPQNYSLSLLNSIIAMLFFEPSTRTRLSHESAALRLGARVIGFADSNTTSAKKGETLEDTIRVINGYADAIVMRHPEPGAAQRAATASDIPIINAGDGSNEHPTQALLDLFTIQEKFGTLDGLHITFVGDLKYGRTVHSLIKAFSLFHVSIACVSPSLLKLPDTIKTTDIKEYETWDEVAQTTDVLYMTRVQEERFDDKEEYNQLKENYILTSQEAEKFSAKKIFMHPLPRVVELSPDIDSDPRAWYFKQAHNGVWMRMAILLHILS